MMRSVLLASLAAAALLACAEGKPPPSSPAAAASSSQPPTAGATEAQGVSRARPALERELATIDANLSDLARRVQVAQEAVNAELQQQLAILQKRDDDLRAQLQATSDAADEGARRAHREIQRAIRVLDQDIKQLEERLTR
jgi:hypothetical protein